MKITLILCTLALSAAAAEPVLVRITPATLARLQARDPTIRVVNSDESKTRNPVNHSINEESTILHDGKNWTLVPNGALVHLPTAMKERVNAKPVGTLLPWSQFLEINRTWILPLEVTFDQAAGIQDIPTATTVSWAKQDKVVVTVRQNDGPVSVQLASLLPALTSR